MTWLIKSKFAIATWVNKLLEFFLSFKIAT